MYKYTPNEIALMTPYQQVMLYDPESISETLTFDSHDEYLQWMSQR